MIESVPLKALRAHAVRRTLFAPAALPAAIDALGFVQLDPIRAPARAADLILRQRVAGYRAGDLDRAYPELPLAEDYVHVYGVMPARTQHLLHPRAPGAVARRAASIRAWPRGSSRMSARTASRIRATCMRRWARPASTTAGAAIRPRRRGCSRRCSIAASCAWRDAKPASGSTTLADARPRARRRRRRGRHDVLRAAAAPVRAAARGEPAQARVHGQRQFDSGGRSRRKPSRACSQVATVRARRGGRGQLRSCRRARRWMREREDRVRVAGAVRSARLGPAPLRAVLGLGVPLRSVHAACRSAASATTRCRSCGATTSIGWANAANVDGRRCGWTLASRSPARAAPRSAARSTRGRGARDFDRAPPHFAIALA